MNVMNMNIEHETWHLRFYKVAGVQNSFYLDCKPLNQERPVFKKMYFLEGWEIADETDDFIIYKNGNESIMLDRIANGENEGTGVQFISWDEAGNNDVTSFTLCGTPNEINSLISYIELVRETANVQNEKHIFLSQVRIQEGGRKRRRSTRRRRTRRGKN